MLSQVNRQTRVLLLKPAHSLSLADPQLHLTGKTLEFAFDSQGGVRTDSPRGLLDCASYFVKYGFCLIFCTEFHNAPPYKPSGIDPYIDSSYKDHSIIFWP